MRRTTFVMVALAALTLSACGGGDDTADEESTTTAAPATTTTMATTTTEATTTTTEPPTTTTTQAEAGACLVGTWDLDSEDFVQQLADGMADAAGAGEVTVSFVGGSYTVTMSEDGTFAAERDEWSFEAATSEGAFRITIDGVDTGMWAVDGDTLTISDVESGSTVKAQAVVNGELVDLPGGTVPVADSDALGASSTYECSGDVLVVHADGGFTSTLTRIDG